MIGFLRPRINERLVGGRRHELGDSLFLAREELVTRRREQSIAKLRRPGCCARRVRRAEPHVPQERKAVDDDDALYAVRCRERELHRDHAADAVADDRRARDVVGLEITLEGRDARRQDGAGRRRDTGKPREREHMRAVLAAQRCNGPVPNRAEEARPGMKSTSAP